MIKVYLFSTKTDAYGFVKQIAAEKYNIKANTLEIKKQTHGKPYFESLPQFYFNLSHTEGIQALAVSDSDVGIDVEKLRTPNLRVVKRFCEDEREYIADSPTRFLEVWTKKEAYLKMQGTGIAGGLASFSIFKTEIPIKTVFFENYVLSLCGNGNFEVVDLRKKA